MTAIYTVSVDSIEANTFRGRVHLINSDVPYVSEEPVFPLSLLADAWWRIDKGYLRDEGDVRNSRERYPLTMDQGQAITAGMRLREEFTHLFALILGREIRVTEDGYLLTEDGKEVLEPKRKAADVYLLDGGRGHDGVSHYVMTSGDEDAFEERADEIITSYEVGEYRNVPLLSEVAAAENEPWDPREPDGPADLDEYGPWRILRDRGFLERPYADIAVTVSDPGYLEHLVAGMQWDTTMTGDVC